MAGKGKLRTVMAAAMFAATAASASQIGSGSVAKKSYDVHETMTRAAQECVEAYDKAFPVDCSDRFGSVLERVRLAQAPAPPPSAREEEKIRYSARWPDDPIRMLDKERSKLAFGLQLFGKCRGALNRGPHIDDVGLLCASHYGRLQFMHAQASPVDRGDAAAARRRILAWAEFAYRVATDSHYRQSDYCRAVAALDDKALEKALTFSDTDSATSLCVRRKGMPPWRVATLFGLRCHSVLQGLRCREASVIKDDNDAARIAAIGALLHLVQDSFSQSHVARIPPGEAATGARGPFRPRSVCAAPSIYYDYQQQAYPTPDDFGNITDDPHGAADFPPELDRTCRDPKRHVDDVITASAAMLYYVRRPDPAAFKKYIETRVFPG